MAHIVYFVAGVGPNQPEEVVLKAGVVDIRCFALRIWFPFGKSI